ncbi:polysialic acid transport protein KpsD precursor [mine drainage metagenome]|uniref:Polysialic acid transport protein KpsD n=1 Tax=mine drainage metagenome TaxID=410659 RepID=A0A1J5SSK3_9ZZZZ
MKKLKKGFATVLAVFLFAAMSFAQQASGINIDNLSDQQLQQYLGMGSGMSEADAIAKAKEKGLSDEQIQKLRLRLQKLNGSGATTAKADSTDLRTAVPTKSPNNQALLINGLPVFGSNLFAKENLTFEPNLQIPTPVNYQIGTGDQLNIDLFGYSDANFKLKVSPDGTIRIPNLGPVKVAGLSFETAQQKIKSQLSKIYPQIASGQTSIQVTLGTIRSIRVTLIGEIQKPGTYTLPSLATIANALYVSGGPDDIGSYRDIQLVRNGKTIAVFDLYDFLLKGDLTKNLRLEDDDIIRVNPYETRVIVTGAIKRKAIYEAKKNESLQEMITTAGGFADNAYREFIRLERNTKNAKEAITVTNKQFKDFGLLSGDNFTIDSISSRFTNKVVITGAVYHPGVYSTQEYATLKPLLQTAGLKEEAYLQRAMIKRRDANFIPTTIDVNIADILSNKTDISLQREDSVQIFSLLDLRGKYSVTINGEVNKPDSYNYSDNLQLQDLILMAGGFKDGASGKKIEIARRVRDSVTEKDSNRYSIVKVIELNKQLDESSDAPKFLLQPFDIVSVRKNPSYLEQITIKVEGQVLYPGDYSIEKRQERISDIIQRAGGFKSDAYLPGALLIRGKKDDANAKAQDLQRMNLLSSSDSTKNMNSDSLISKMNAFTSSIGINLQEAINHPGSKYDVFVEEGDRLIIPKEKLTVRTSGAVYMSKQIVFEGNTSFRKYIDQSGGFSAQALRSRSFVIYANGSVARTHHFLFFNTYPKVDQGSEIFVPAKKVNTNRLAGMAATAGLLATVSTALFTIIYVTKL